MKNFTIIFSLLITISCDFQNDPDIPAPVWNVAQPNEVGLDEDLLLEMDQRIREGVYGQINSLIIVKDDNLVFENYYDGDRLGETFIQGSTVSVASLIAGIALDQGVLPGFDTRISELLNNQAPFQDELRAEITVGNLLQMNSGIAWNEFLTPFGAPQNTASQMANSANWSDFTLGVEMEARPGGRFAYSSGSMMILSDIIQEQTGSSMAIFAQRNLFEPLDISFSWSTDPSGLTNAAWGLSLNPTDFAKIGYLALNNGNWFGNQIVSFDYIEEMSSLQSQFNFNNDFGFAWWRFSDFSFFVQNLEENDIFFSWGGGGQFCFVIPHLDMVVTTTASNFGTEVSDQVAFTILFDEILAAQVDPVLD